MASGKAMRRLLPLFVLLLVCTACTPKYRAQQEHPLLGSDMAARQQLELTWHRFAHAVAVGEVTGETDEKLMHKATEVTLRRNKLLAVAPERASYRVDVETHRLDGRVSEGRTVVQADLTYRLRRAADNAVLAEWRFETARSAHLNRRPDTPEEQEDKDAIAAAQLGGTLVWALVLGGPGPFVGGGDASKDALEDRKQFLRLTGLAMRENMTLFLQELNAFEATLPAS